MNPNAQKDLLLSTDYPLDKIVRYITGSYTTNPAIHPFYEEFFIAISDIPYMVAATITWSYTPDFAITYSAADTSVIDPSPTSSYLSVSVSCNASYSSGTSLSNHEVRVILEKGQGGPARTIYYRIILYPIEDGVLLRSSSEANISDFILNTDNNYLKLLDSGLLATPSLDTVYSKYHGLGYRPTVICWLVNINPGFGYGSDNYIVPYLEPSSSQGVLNMVYVDNNYLYTRNPGAQFLASHIAYRIYIDES